TILREEGQGRNSAALCECGLCALFVYEELCTIAINSIYNFYFLKHTIFHLTYAQSLLIVEVVLLVGAILGSLTPH
ncbi:hypothetical protein, partial [Staphylococcus equorum]|uniref:hypothetical protein n=1 Tax=Staphylococcus equorum TaxID=246432 RepID=UPI003EB8476E